MERRELHSSGLGEEKQEELCEQGNKLMNCSKYGHFLAT